MVILLLVGLPMIRMSRMTMPSRRRDAVKAFVGLDFSDTESSSVENITPKPFRGDPQATVRSPTTNETKSRPSLLTVPVEIRLQIYDLLLVSRSTREDNPSWPVGDTCQVMIMLSMKKDPQQRTINPAIIRICGQIRREANPILYTGNVFNFRQPDQMFRFMTQIGPTNIKFVRSLDMWIPWKAEILPWLTLLNALSQEAAALKYVRVAWNSRYESPRMLQKGAKERGLGDNVLFIRALATFQGLEKIHIRGHYAKHWPSYLTAKTSAQVQAEIGLGHYEPEPDDDPQTIQWIQTLNESNLHKFREYQRGTEDLIP
ncbi:uncharacterized protein N7503_005524 [Penicillium pulvis]|uniref:uncharacterized protein n=1 Tax=Penicillium pulvis TaxID=1562058 RepID=UPI0025499964|nr:uncharacterized protein N7503_005524 [Penicillium pulvis]KAJ5803074.1 hypothetical protein N7503_005524 [Penicillium pulvis]